MVKSLKKRLASLLVATTMATMVPINVFAADYADHWAKTSIERWIDSGLLKGYEDGTFKPKQAITRAELAAFLVRVKGLEKTEKIEYTDVASDAWYAGDIAKVSAAGIMHIEGTAFKPNQAATREEAAYAIAKAYHVASSDKLKFVDSSSISDWAKESVGALYNHGYINGRPDNTFAPKDTLTRADLIVMLDKITGQVINKEGTYTTDIEGNVVINVPNVTLKGLTIKGNLYLGEGVGEGDVFLEDVTVEGTTYVEGGGENSIHLNNSTLLTVVVNKQTGTVRLVAEGDTRVDQVEIQSSAILMESGVTGAGFTDVSLSSLLPSDASVKLTGSFETVEVLAHTIKLDIPSGSVDLLSILESAHNVGINLGTNVTVQSAVINAPTTISGSGTITNATVNSNSVVLNANVTNVSVADGTTAPTGTGVTNSTSNNTTNSSTNNNTNHNTNNNHHNGGTTAPTVANFKMEVTPSYGQQIAIKLDTNQQIVYDLNNLADNTVEVNATIGDEVVNWDFAEYDADQRTLYLIPNNLYTSNNVGKIFTVQVTGKYGLRGTCTQSVAFYGFAGRVYDTNSQGVEGVEISFRSGLNNTDGPVVATAVTDKEGHYGVFIQPGVYTGTMAKPGYMSSNRIVATSATNAFNADESAVFIAVPLAGEMRTVLTWGMTPRDLDSHLFALLRNNDGYHTAFYDKVAAKPNGEGIYADLDWDDTTSYGPETTTIRDLQPGRYSFYVHNFSGAPDIATSQAKVEVYYGADTPMKVFNVPTEASGKLYWHVYDMIVSDQYEVTIQEVNQLVDEMERMNPAYDGAHVQNIYAAVTTSSNMQTTGGNLQTTGSNIQTTGGNIQTTGSQYRVDTNVDYTNNISSYRYIQQDYIQVTTGSHLALRLAHGISISRAISAKVYTAEVPINYMGIGTYENVAIDKDNKYVYIPLAEARYQVYELTIDGEKSYLYIERVHE